MWRGALFTSPSNPGSQCPASAADGAHRGQHRPDSPRHAVHHHGPTDQATTHHGTPDHATTHANTPHPTHRHGTPDETAIRQAVLHRLDLLDQAATHADPSTLLPLARAELNRLADGWRVLLRSHHTDEAGRCAACRTGLRARRWPCPVWRSAHEQLIGDGLPHRERTHPLRNPFRPT